MVSIFNLAHLWHRGWSILDVTDPSSPELVKFIPGPQNTWTIQIQVAEGKMITALERIAPGWGGDDNRGYSEGFLIWDVSNPIDPRLLGHFHTGSTGTHRNFYDGGQFVHAAAAAPVLAEKFIASSILSILGSRRRRADFHCRNRPTTQQLPG